MNNLVLPISVVILTKDSERTLKKTLQRAKKFPEVLIIDTGSKDKTLEIAGAFSNVKIFNKKLTKFGTLRNEAASLASQDWILALDSDEVLSKDLIEELQMVPLDSDHVYSFPFHNYYQKKWIKWCGWHPESHIRLYHKKTTKFSEDHVHESVLFNDQKVISLHNPIHHYPYHSTEDFLVKMQHYSTLFAEQYHLQKKSSLKKAISHGFFAFIKSYFLKRGFLGGRQGFIISVYNGNTAFYKYLKLAEKNSTKCS